MARVEINGPGVVPPQYKPATRPAQVPGRQPIVTGKVQANRRLETAPPSVPLEAAPVIPSTPQVAEPIAHFPTEEHRFPTIVNHHTLRSSNPEVTQDVNTPVTASGADDLAIVAQFVRDMTINKHSLTQVSTREYIGLATKTISLEPLRRITRIPLALTIQEGQFYAYPVLRKREWKIPVVVSEPDPSAPPETPVAPAPVKRAKKK